MNDVSTTMDTSGYKEGDVEKLQHQQAVETGIIRDVKQRDAQSKSSGYERGSVQRHRRAVRRRAMAQAEQRRIAEHDAEKRATQEQHLREQRRRQVAQRETQNQYPDAARRNTLEELDDEEKADRIIAAATASAAATETTKDDDAAKMLAKELKKIKDTPQESIEDSPLGARLMRKMRL